MKFNLQTITRKMTFLLLFLFGLFALGAVPVQAEGDDERRCAIYLSADVPHWGTCLFAEDCVASDLMYSNDAQQCWGTGRTCCMPKITCDHNNDGFAVRRVRALAAARTPGRPHTKSSLFHLLLIFVLAFFCFTFVPTALSCNAISGLFDATNAPRARCAAVSRWATAFAGTSIAASPTMEKRSKVRPTSCRLCASSVRGRPTLSVASQSAR